MKVSRAFEGDTRGRRALRHEFSPDGVGTGESDTGDQYRQYGKLADDLPATLLAIQRAFWGHVGKATSVTEEGFRSPLSARHSRRSPPFCCEPTSLDQREEALSSFRRPTFACLSLFMPAGATHWSSLGTSDGPQSRANNFFRFDLKDGEIIRFSPCWALCFAEAAGQS